MNKPISASVLLALTSASVAVAAPDLMDTAQVISSKPIVERVSEPRQECAPGAAGAPAPAQERSMVAPIVGGVAGAIIGSQVGRGSGKTAATAAGAVAGTIVGDRVANPDSNRSSTGAVVGGVAGGLLGAQVGGGSGRNTAAAAGAVAGTIAGDRIDNRQQTAATQPAQRCRTVETTREIIKGYSVVYRYNGRDITTTMPYDPGKTVRVGITAIDGSGEAAAPTASMMGTNVREVNPGSSAPVPAPATPISNTGGYNYRY